MTGYQQTLESQLWPADLQDCPPPLSGWNAPRICKEFGSPVCCSPRGKQQILIQFFWFTWNDHRKKHRIVMNFPCDSTFRSWAGWEILGSIFGIGEVSDLCPDLSWDVSNMKLNICQLQLGPLLSRVKCSLQGTEQFMDSYGFILLLVQLDFCLQVICWHQLASFHGIFSVLDSVVSSHNCLARTQHSEKVTKYCGCRFMFRSPWLEFSVSDLQKKNTVMLRSTICHVHLGNPWWQARGFVCHTLASDVWYFCFKGNSIV